MKEQADPLLTNFLSGSGANLLFLIGFMIYRKIDQCCKNSHSKSKCHTCCLDVEWEDNSSESDIESGRLNGTETETDLQKMYRREYQNIHKKSKKVVQARKHERHTYERYLAWKRRRSEEIRKAPTLETQKSLRFRSHSF